MIFFFFHTAFDKNVGQFYSTRLTALALHFLLIEIALERSRTANNAKSWFGLKALLKITKKYFDDCDAVDHTIIMKAG